MITVGNVGPIWIDLGTSTGTERDTTMQEAQRYGIPTGWYEWE